MVEKGMSCVKYLLFAFNLLFFIFGAVLIGVGAYVQIKLSSYSDFTTTSINGAAIVIIVVGVITFVVGFLGCCGAIKENHCMVMTFAILIGIILVCELGAGIAGYVLQRDVANLFSKTMKSSMQGYRDDKNGVKKSWDNIQQELECCGTENATDWDEYFDGDSLPNSCCKSDTDGCKISSTDRFSKGCLRRLEDEFDNNIGIVAGAAIGLAVVELIGIILACCLARAIRSEYEVA